MTDLHDIETQLNAATSVFSAIPEWIDEEPTLVIPNITMRELIYGATVEVMVAS